MSRAGTMNKAIVVVLAGALGALAAGRAALAETPEELLNRAEQLADGGHLSRAADLYKAFIHDNPNHSQLPAARYRYARCLDAMGLVDEAVAQLKLVIESGQKRFRNRQDAFYMLGKLYASLKNYEQATRTFEAMLLEAGGGGLYRAEVIDLCGGYYAILGRNEEAAAKFNLLRNSADAHYAERAAVKIAVLWLKAGRTDLAAGAVQDLANAFPRNGQIPGLMVQIADQLRTGRKFDEAAAVCVQVVGRFDGTAEATAARYILGLCLRDRKQFEKAAEAFVQIARDPRARKDGLAAEALYQAAEIQNGDLHQVDKAMQLYREAGIAARSIDSERAKAIAEQCYFTLAEHHYAKKEYAVALEYYLLLKGLGAKLNVLGRILKCQEEIGADGNPQIGSEADLEQLKKKIAENPGTFVAAEGEVFLLDRDMNRLIGREGANLAPVVAGYQAILKKYPADVLANNSLGAYVQVQIGLCQAKSADAKTLEAAMASFRAAAKADPDGPYATVALENLAMTADKAGDRQTAFATYQELFDRSSGKLVKDPASAEARKTSSEYLKSMLSRAEKADSIEKALELAHKVVDDTGPFSPLARDAQFYIGELYFLKKDFSASAREFRRYIQMFGPKQAPDGELVEQPFKPATVDDKVAQLYEAAVRIAQCWTMQGHTQNMIAAYQWLTRNLSYRNIHMAEAEYWLAVEIGKGRKGDDPEVRRQEAVALWTKVINPSMNFADRHLADHCHSWVSAGSPEADKYVRAAALRAGELFSGLNEHDKAAGIFEQFLNDFSADRTRRRRTTNPDPKAAELYSIARYALGREYIALGSVTRLIDCYEPYLKGLRDDRFRVSALKLLGYHAGKAGRFEEAADAYATLLDEYGPNTYDDKGKLIPVKYAERLRRSSYHWNGVRLPPPKGFDPGDIRYSLGYLYFKQGDFARCVKVLGPFIDDPALARDKSAANALYMVGQSHYRLYDYKSGVEVMARLVRDFPRFGVYDEVCVNAARGYCETEQWPQLSRLCAQFVRQRPASERRPHMDLYAAVALLGEGKTADGLAQLSAIARSNTYEDVKAGANYFLGRHHMAARPPDYAKALDCLQQSIRIYPRARSCLAAARCAIELKRWDAARQLLDRTVREFPGSDPRLIDQARRLLPDVLKELANQKK